MRKSVLSIMLLFAISMAASAQKFALIDTEYILKNIPAYQAIAGSYEEISKRSGGNCQGSTEDVPGLSSSVLYSLCGSED